MMKSLLLLLLAALSAQTVAQSFTSGEELLSAMHKKYSQGPCNCYTFSQKNIHYTGDSVIGNSVWHEKIVFPDRFTINFGDTAKGNFIIFRNDSALNYRSGKQVKSRADTNSLLLLLGGMYYRPLDAVKSRLKQAGYNFSALSSQTWNGENVYVVGDTANASQPNQVWIAKKDLRILRVMEKMNASDVMDMRFESHQKWCRGFVETKVSFRRNGKLEQVEEYYDLKECDVQSPKK